jgi:hypothetical protein
MKKMQNVITEQLEAYASAAGNQITVERDWNNTGRFFVFLEDGPHDMRFSFQTQYVTLEDENNSYSYWYTKHWEQLITALQNFANTGNVRGER